jgi:hypothetical protein
VSTCWTAARLDPNRTTSAGGSVSLAAESAEGLAHATEAQRAAIVRMRNEGVISADVMRRVERDLDLEESRLEI